MTVTSFLNITNKIYKGGTLAKRLYKGDTPVYRAYKGSTLIYEMWKTYLTADTQFSIEATAQSPSSFIDVYSYGVDYDNKQHDLEYTFSPTTIDKNTTTSVKTHTVTINQTRTGQKITATIIQEGNKQSTISYSTPTVVSIQVDSVPASGGTACAYVNYQQTKTTHYTNGDTVNETLQGQITATILAGTKGEGTTTLTNGTIKVESAYTTPYTDKRLVYTVSKIGFTVNSKYTESSAQVGIYQDENSRSSSPTSYGSWNVSCVNNASTNIANTGGTMSVNVNSYRTNTYTWTSGSTDTSTEFGSGTVSGSNVTELPTTFTGKSGGTIINGSVAENLGAARTCTISITSNSITKSASRTQNAVAYVFTTSTSSSIDCNATQSTVNIVVTSTRNGKVWGIAKSDVSVSNSSIATVGTVTSSSSIYTIPITMAANTGAARSVTVTVTQPGSGNKKTFTINQSTGVVKETATIVFHSVKYTNDTTISYNLDVTAEDTSKYSGGSVGSVKIYLNTAPNATGENATNKTLASSLTLAAGKKQNYTGTISVGSNYAGRVYMLGYLNNKLVSYTDITGYNGGGSGGGSGDEGEAPEG